MSKVRTVVDLENKEIREVLIEKARSMVKHETGGSSTIDFQWEEGAKNLTAVVTFHK